MVAEFGQFCLILALLASVWQFLIKFIFKDIGTVFHQQKTIQWIIFCMVVLAYGLLTYCFMTDDFTVTYVAKQSNSLLPWYYKLTALWGGHEGSLLLWVFILTGWSLVFALITRLEVRISSTTLQVLAFIQVCFLFLLLNASSPFERALPDIIIDGIDLNPLLQDFGFIFHPPILYLGYVGLAIPFAIAQAILWQGIYHADMLCALRPWTLVSWGILSVGIALGSWWAYYELGWGGWWFWDPVENASFMPWLTATALLHSLLVANRHPSYALWSFILAILAFVLSVLGTFLVRSGALSSVHAFASDPTRGLYLFIILSLLLCVSAGLLFYRKKMWQVAEAPIRLLTKTGVIFTGSVLLMVVVASICLGTIYPLISEHIFSQTLAIGPPYFNTIFILLMLPILLLLIIGTMWQSKNTKKTFQYYLMSGLLAIGITVVLLTWTSLTWHWNVLLGLSLGLWIVFGITTKIVVHRVQYKRFNFSSREIAMIGGHLAVALAVIGIVIVSNYQIEKEIEIKQGQSYTLGPYEISVGSFETIVGPNFVGTEAMMDVKQDGDVKKTLYPQKRLYFIQDISMSETAIWPGLFRDIYVALGEPISATSWSARLYYKPFVRWIWFSAVLMLLASLMGLKTRHRKG